MSGARAGVSLSQLLAEVDRLERELKDLGREAQRGGDFVHQLQEIVERDTKRMEDIERNTSKISQEMVEWEARERFLTDAISTGTQSSQLLVQMESQARSKLEEERKISNQLKEELVVKVRMFAKKVEDEEDKYQKIPQYVRMLKIEESIMKKTGMVEHLEREVGQMAGEKEMWMREVKKDREAWSGFRASCLNLAEQWLEMRKMGKEVDILRKEKIKMDEQMSSLLEERKAIITAVLHQHPVLDVVRSQDILPSFTQPPPPCRELAKKTNITTLSSLNTYTLPSLTPSVTLKPPTQPPPSTYVPPTPRTKLLHLKLGTSLLSKKKTSGVYSTFTQPPIQNDISHHGRKTPPIIPPLNISPSPQPQLSTPLKHPDILQPVKMKSFKLGLPSLFGRKKMAAVVQNTSVKEVVLTRNPTLPTKEMEVVLEKDTMDMEGVDVQMQDAGTTTRDICRSSSLELALPAAYAPAQQLPSCKAFSSPSSSLTAAAPTTQLLPGILPTDSKQLLVTSQPEQQLSLPPPVPTHKLSPAQPTAAVPTLQQSPTPSPMMSKRKALCVSPGTALSDKKREAVLQQLLESPQPGRETRTVLDVDREKVERIMSPPPGAAVASGDGSFGGFAFGGESSAGFNFENNNDETNNDFSFGGCLNKEAFSFGDGGAEGAGDFSFFGGGEGDKGEETQGDGEGFSFSFGGGFEGEKDGGGGGFSLF